MRDVIGSHAMSICIGWADADLIIYQASDSYTSMFLPPVMLYRLIENLQALSLINEYAVSDVTSVAMDGEAPELRQEGALREERHSQRTACT